MNFINERAVLPPESPSKISRMAKKRGAETAEVFLQVSST
jgi:hypothetical protein